MIKFSTKIAKDNTEENDVGRIEVERTENSVRVTVIYDYQTPTFAEIPIEQFKKMAAFLTD